MESEGEIGGGNDVLYLSISLLCIVWMKSGRSIVRVPVPSLFCYCNKGSFVGSAEYDFSFSLSCFSLFWNKEALCGSIVQRGFPLRGL